ncbi:MAG: CRTAC1 family protein, partial [candidate division Zixibacteria bacterium]|nr:CRTAC1 family protein [candidate division Zixibacteria bacterium]
TTDIIGSYSRHTYGASWGDYDNDGDPDLVNTNNMGERSDLFQNNGNGSFSLLSYSILGTDGTNIGGCSWADFDNDGNLDLYIAAYWPGPSQLYRNNGGGSLTRVSGHGLGLLDGRSNSGVWGDYDNDGDQDIFVWLNDFEVPINSRGYLFQNLGDGTFSQVPAAQFECDSCSADAAAWGDIDRDGDLDLLVARMDPQWQGRPEYMNELLYLNNGNNNHWITVKPVGTTSNRSAVGVKIRIKATISGQPIWQLQELQTQTGLRSQGPLELHFGLGDAMVIDSLKLEWPSGIVQMRENVTVDQYLTIYESCCEGRVGNANDFGTYPQEVTISDIQSLVTAKFIVGRCDGLVSCIAEGDANQSGGTSPACKDITISDIQMLVNHLFIAGPANAPLNDCL